MDSGGRGACLRVQLGAKGLEGPVRAWEGLEGHDRLALKPNDTKGGGEQSDTILRMLIVAEGHWVLIRAPFETWGGQFEFERRVGSNFWFMHGGLPGSSLCAYGK